MGVPVTNHVGLLCSYRQRHAIVRWLWKGMQPVSARFWVDCGSLWISTLQYRYSTVNFVQNTQTPNRHKIADPSRRNIGCMIWVKCVIYGYVLYFPGFMPYRTMINRVIMTLGSGRTFLNMACLHFHYPMIINELFSDYPPRFHHDSDAIWASMLTRKGKGRPP